MYNRFLVLLSFLIIYSTNTIAQNYSKTPIAITDIKKGINDIEFFRTVLIEKGFKFDKRNNDGEFWYINVDSGDELDRKYKKQLALQYYTINNGNNVNRKTLFIQIRKDLLPTYKDFFFNQVKSAFPIKEAVPVTIKTDYANKITVKEDYILVFSSTSSKIKVEYKEDEYWASFSFRLDTK